LFSARTITFRQRAYKPFAGLRQKRASAFTDSGGLWRSIVNRLGDGLIMQ